MEKYKCIKTMYMLNSDDITDDLERPAFIEGKIYECKGNYFKSERTRGFNHYMSNQDLEGILVKIESTDQFIIELKVDSFLDLLIQEYGLEVVQEVIDIVTEKSNKQMQIKKTLEE